MNPEAPVMMRRGNCTAVYCTPDPVPAPAPVPVLEMGMGSGGLGDGEPCFQRSFILFHKNWSDADSGAGTGTGTGTA